MNHGYAVYDQTDVTTANPLKLILMLYDGAINFLHKAIECTDQKDVAGKNLNANSAIDIILELNSALDVKAGGEFAQSLRRLYFFMNRHVMEASWRDSAKGFKEVIDLLGELRESWQEIYNSKDRMEVQQQLEAPRHRMMSLRA